MYKETLYKFFDDDELLRISKHIKQSESKTSGELVVVLKEKKKIFEKKFNVRQLAEKEFVKAGIKKTKESTGIMIFIILESREFYILADQTINTNVPQATWHLIAEEMSKKFKVGQFSEGVIFAVQKAGEILSKHLPIKEGDVNELSNKVVID